MKVRTTRSRRGTVAAVLTLALVATVGTTLTGSASAADRTATEHRADGKVVATKTSAKPKLFDIGHHAGEPTIGFSRDGSLFYTAGAGCVTSCAGQPQMAETVTPGGRAVMMTPDNGKTWKNVSPGLPDQGASPHVFSLDPMLFVDHNSDSDRVFDIDLNAACAELSYSDDHGATWITNPLACGEPVNDHQTLFSGKPTTTAAVTPLYGKILYYCYNKLEYTKCSKSLDGGLTFIDTTGLTNPPCSGLNGHGVTDSKGWIFLPYTGCGNAPTIAMSKDEGDTWQILTVPGEKVNGGDPSVAIDKKDNVYFLWDDADRKVKLATSTNHGTSWSKPLDVTAPGVKVTDLATLTVGAPGKVAIAYLGTTSDEKKAFWNGYLASGVGVLGKSPTFYSASINDPKHPLKATGGSNTDCGPGRCGRILDFLDVEIAPNGAPWGAYVDACYATCEKTGVESYADNEGMAGTLVGGPRLNR
ncbi:MAG: hemagglutinin protein [Frankiales bacterium]|nr:hemagglutinin protein [Frankiales bacterium]